MFHTVTHQYSKTVSWLQILKYWTWILNNCTQWLFTFYRLRFFNYYYCIAFLLILSLIVVTFPQYCVALFLYSGPEWVVHLVHTVIVKLTYYNQVRVVTKCVFKPHYPDLFISNRNVVKLWLHTSKECFSGHFQSIIWQTLKSAQTL